MLDPAIQSDLDARLEETFLHVAAAEETYKGLFGRYWQGLPDGSGGGAKDTEITKAATEDTEAVVKETPHDWTYVGLAPPAEHDVRVDVYEAPDGHGYSVTIRALDDKGVVYERCEATGPEAKARTHEWREAG